jgi:malonyl-CoA/methylmalonyl-CoA synthetase
MWACSLSSRTGSRHRIATSALPARRPCYTVRMASTLPRLPLFEALKKHDAHRTAVVHSLSGRAFTYGELVNDVAAAKDKLQRSTRGTSVAGERISFLVENGYDYVGARPLSLSTCPWEDYCSN